MRRGFDVPIYLHPAPQPVIDISYGFAPMVIDMLAGGAWVAHRNRGSMIRIICGGVSTVFEIAIRDRPHGEGSTLLLPAAGHHSHGGDS